MGIQKNGLPLHSRLRDAREFSSVGLEHLPYKQRVGGSTPSTPTDQKAFCTSAGRFFCGFLYPVLLLSSRYRPNAKTRLFCISLIAISGMTAIITIFEQSGVLSLKGLILNCFQLFPYPTRLREKVIYHLYAIRYMAGAGGMFFGALCQAKA